MKRRGRRVESGVELLDGCPKDGSKKGVTRNQAEQRGGLEVRKRGAAPVTQLCYFLGEVGNNR